jgi:hypothetical protein
MNTQLAIPIPTSLFLELVDFLNKHKSNRDPVIAVVDAISYWMENADWKSEQLMPETVLSNTNGYTWKYKDNSLFLPHGTGIRMRYKGKYHYAAVEGDEIKYQGETVTPAYLANFITRTPKALGSRNAWKDLWIKSPTKQQWELADNLRKLQQKFLEEFN